MAYRMRVRRGAMSRLRRMGYRKRPALRLPKRQASRLKEIAKADRYALTSRQYDLGKFGGTDIANSRTSCLFCMTNAFDADEVFHINRLRVDYNIAWLLSRDRTSGFAPLPGLNLSIWMAIFDTKDITLCNTDAKRGAFVKLKADYFDILSSADRDSKRGVRLQRYREIQCPVVPKVSNSQRPDPARHLALSPPPFKLRPGQFWAAGVTSSRDNGAFTNDIYYMMATLRVQSTSGDITNKNQAPTFNGGTSGFDDQAAARDTEGTWFSLT